MKNLKSLFLTVSSLILVINSYAGINKDSALKLTNLEIGYPCPAIPFYHFLAEIELPHASIIEVEAAVNGKVLRFTDLHRADAITDMNRPIISHRPPSGYGLSQDGTLYEHPHLVGWMNWEPGKEYEIRIRVRMKKSIQGSEDDEFLSATKKIKAPDGIPVFSNAWKNYKSLVLSETAGIDRIGDPVEVLLPFYPDEAQQLTRDIRVVSIDPITYDFKEIPSQVYDIKNYLEEDDLKPDEGGNPTRDVPLWMPTVTCRLAFLADVKAKTSQVYLVYYNNEHALTKTYETDLQVQGEAPGLQVDNDLYTISLHPNSGHLDQIILKKKPEFPFFHRLED